MSEVSYKALRNAVERLRDALIATKSCKNPFAVAVKIATVVWGIDSFLQGAALSFFVNGPHQYRQTAFIELVYESVFVGGLISFLWSRIASIALCGATLGSLAMLLWTKSFGHGASYALPLLWAIALRPALASLVLFLLSFYEGRLGKRELLASGIHGSA